MSGILILIISIAALGLAYVFYGRYLTRKFGEDPSRPTPAHTMEDGVDYVPTKKIVLLGHHFSSIAGAGPINGPILAAPFGWLAVLLWVLIGSVFFGGVQDYSALFISTRTQGKSLGTIIERNIGKMGKKLFLLFAYFTLILVIAAFADIVASTFNGFDASGAIVPENGATASASVLFIVLAILFGFAVYRRKMNLVAASIIGVLLLAGCIALSFVMPIYLNKVIWLVIVFIYVYAASVAPVWVVLQPRDYLCSFLLYATMILAFVGIFASNPIIQIPAFTGFIANGQMLFPMLFVTVACGAISGFHSAVASGTTAKQLDNEKDARLIGYGGMLIEGVLAVIALISVASFAFGSTVTSGTPAQVFAGGIAQFTLVLGIPANVTMTILTLAISAFALTSLDTCARLARFLLTEYFINADDDVNNLPKWKKIVTNKYMATLITIAFGVALAVIGYQTIWGLFGSANQLLAAIALLAAAVWLKNRGKTTKALFIPMCFMLIMTLTALVITFINNIGGISAPGADLFKIIVQCILCVVLFVLAIRLAIEGIKTMKEAKNRPVMTDD